MLNVIGIVHSTGVYNGSKYDNYNLHCVRSAKEDNVNEDGAITEVIKVKASIFEDSGVSIGSDIDVFYDRYGRIVSFKVY